MTGSVVLHVTLYPEAFNAASMNLAAGRLVGHNQLEVRSIVGYICVTVECALVLREVAVDGSRLLHISYQWASAMKDDLFNEEHT
jgi:hypothetical protein